MSEDIDSKEAYMRAMVQARRERDDISSQLMDADIDLHDWTEDIAHALGIQTWHESWWDSKKEEQRAKILERIKRLRLDKEGQSR